MLFRSDAIDICMVFSVIKNGVKLSFRSCIKEVSASEMAQEVAGIKRKEGNLSVWSREWLL